MIEVEFVTLGDAASKLDVPPSTLRNWTEQLEKFNAHYVLRNERKERIYYENDIEIFKFMRDLKAEHGRKTTTRDLAYMIVEQDFEIRLKEDIPEPIPTNHAMELLDNDDIKEVLASDRVRQLMEVIIGETTKNLRDELVKEVRKEVHDEMEDFGKKMEEIDKRNDERMNNLIGEWRAYRESRQQRTFLQRLFNKD